MEEEEVMALYVRLHASFFSHRKTIRLQSRLGSDALWIVPRLWCYAATNQCDGDFSSYSADEIALLLGYSKDASSMLQALQECGFMDEMQIHDWVQHNEYHATFSERAKNAANARWSKRKGLDKKGQEQAMLEHAPSIVLPFTSSEFSLAWNKWEGYRKEVKKTLSPTTKDMQLKKLEKMGESRAISALNHSIESGYQGIYEPSANGKVLSSVSAKKSKLVEVPHE